MQQHLIRLPDFHYINLTVKKMRACQSNLLTHPLVL